MRSFPLLPTRAPLLVAALLVTLAGAPRSNAALHTVTVQVDRPGAAISPLMWGIFFEDINFGADGGLYAELVKNRGFEFPEAWMGWSNYLGGAASSLGEIRTADPSSNKTPHYLRITSTATPVFLANEGFRGMGVKAGELYGFSIKARSVEGAARMTVQLVSATGKVLGRATLRNPESSWKELKTSLKALETDAHARLVLGFEGPGTVDLDNVSLFPRNTWKRRPNGLRADMVQALADLHPGFMRFPGGCIVEGRTLPLRYQWKEALGPVADRQLLINRWNNEFKHKPTPDYFQSFGLGFFEYFQLCEDIGAEPLPILNCGMACQFNTGELAPLDQLDTYIQDALDLIEFANGSTSTRWGAIRAQMGHREPFNMKLLGIGNEQWGQQYIDRYVRFARVLKERHPEITLISSAGPAPADERFHFAWVKLRDLRADVVDEHCYAAPNWFFDNAGRYDNYDRNGPKVFMGEYAAQSVAIASPKNRNTLECAIAEAAYMTGMERNAVVVRMTAYAPLFGHNEAWQWTPNLIWCDNLTVVRTPNYYVQQLFARNRGDVILPVALRGGTSDAPASHNSNPRTIYASSTRHNHSGEVILKLVNGSEKESEAEILLEGVRKVAAKGHAVLLTGTGPNSENTFSEPRAVTPKKSEFRAADRFRQLLPAYSLTVLRIRVE